MIENKFEVGRVDTADRKVHAVISLIFSIPFGIELFKTANDISWFSSLHEKYRDVRRLFHSVFSYKTQIFKLNMPRIIVLSFTPDTDKFRTRFMQICLLLVIAAGFVIEERLLINNNHQSSQQHDTLWL